ncbi:MAG: LptF/LptG family permease [Candidatus Omnitrophica bacterium]|nr:LptF/LptG family permease [Candidatus Omnitrophota bacterium]
MKDLLSSIAEGALLFTFIFLLKRIYDLTDLLVAGDATYLVTLKLLSSILPTIMLLTFPMAILLAAMMVYGRLAQDNELTALQAAGYNSRQLLIPVVLIGAILTALLLWWGHRIAPKGLRYFDSMAASILQDTATAGIRPGGFNPLGDYIIVPNTIDDDGIMHNVRMYEHSGGRITTSISAPSGSISYAPIDNSIFLNMQHGNIFQVTEQGRRMNINFDRFDFSIGISGLLNKLAKPSHSENKLSHADLLFTIKNPKPDDASMARWWIRCKIELARRSALPFACLIMAVLGALLGIISGRGKRSSCYAMTIVIIFSYYVMLNFSESLANSEMLSSYVSLWIPNIIGVLIAVYFYYRTVYV